MNKLDYIDALQFRSQGAVDEIFEVLGASESTKETPEEKEGAKLKATTIRVPEDLMDAYDATLGYFHLSRQDTFAHMVHQFIGDAIAGYCYGRGSSGRSEGDCFDMAIAAFNELIESLPLEQQQRVMEIAAPALNRKLGGDYV